MKIVQVLTAQKEFAHLTHLKAIAPVIQIAQVTNAEKELVLLIWYLAGVYIIVIV